MTQSGHGVQGKEEQGTKTSLAFAQAILLTFFLHEFHIGTLYAE